MLKNMERSAIHFLKQKGWTNTQIAELTGHHRDTVAQVLAEPVEKVPKKRNRKSKVALYDDQIKEWLDKKIPVSRMLELAREDKVNPYDGGQTVFYDYVRSLRRKKGQIPQQMVVRFEGLPGEYLQIDWGEYRNFPFTKPELKGQTRFFFAARLKFSRFVFVKFTTNMVEETLLRCLVECFVTLGGVPWAVVTDNMKTVTLGRDDQNRPIWHPAYLKLALEMQFHPEVCAPASGNQKGAVENLVKYVKHNFVAGREFFDETDLNGELASWLHRINYERPNDATALPPAELLPKEQAQLSALVPHSFDYGFFESVIVNREGLVNLQTNRYSVPARLVGQPLVARLYLDRVEFYSGAELVARHPRSYQRLKRVVDPAHFEEAFKHKPRARVMSYRDWLVGLSDTAENYISTICKKRREVMDQQIIALYELAQQLGQPDFLAALELAAQQQSFGAEYIAALTFTPGPADRLTPKKEAAAGPPAQLPWPNTVGTRSGTYLMVAGPDSGNSEVSGFGPAGDGELERSLAAYEEFVANRAQLALVERAAGL